MNAYVLGYLLAALVWRQARLKAEFSGTLDTLLDKLNNIRLTTLLEVTNRRGQPKAIRQLEEMSEDQKRLLDALDLAEIHQHPLKIQGVSVYS